MGCKGFCIRQKLNCLDVSLASLCCYREERLVILSKEIECRRIINRHHPDGKRSCNNFDAPNSRSTLFSTVGRNLEAPSRNDMCRDTLPAAGNRRTRCLSADVVHSAWNTGWPKHREVQGHRATIVVRGRESRPHGEGLQVNRIFYPRDRSG